MAGFNMIELLVTIIIAGILAAIAVPSYTTFIANQRVKNASYDLMSALTLARSEAIKRNASVAITTGSAWQNGWSITVVGGTTLNVQDALRGVTIDGSTDTVTYAANGRANAASFEISSTATTSVSPRCVSVDLSGRPNSKVGGC